MNVIVISPDFPHINVALCRNLAAVGIRTLGVGDASYDDLDAVLKESLTEYYKVDNLDDYSDVYRAVAFFAHKYGKPDVIESNNSYWLAMDRQLRTDFNVPGPTASDPDLGEALAQAGITLTEPSGQVISWEGLVDADGNVVAEGATRWPSISRRDYSYRTTPVTDELAAMGRRVVRALGSRSTFLHVQTVGKDYVKVSRCAAPAFTIDMQNYAHGFDLYAMYARVLAATDPHLSPTPLPDAMPAGICVYASRSTNVDYVYSTASIEERWNVVHAAHNPVQYAGGMGDFYMMAIVDSDADADRFAEEVTARG